MIGALMPWRALLLAPALGIALAAGARADLPTIEWQAPSGCPSERAARAVIARAIAASEPGTVRAVRAQIERAGDEHRLDLAVDTAAGSVRRQLFARHCSTLVEVIALELEISALPLERASAGHGRVRRARSRIGWGTRVSAGSGTGPVPDLAPRVALSAALFGPRVRFELGASYDFPKQLHYDAPDAVGARLDVVAGHSRACYALLAPHVEIPLCAGAEVGVMRGFGMGVEQAFEAPRLWSALFAAPALRFPRHGPVSMWLEVGGYWALRRPTFQVRNLPPLYRPDALAVRGAAGINLQFD